MNKIGFFALGVCALLGTLTNFSSCKEEGETLEEAIERGKWRDTIWVKDDLFQMARKVKRSSSTNVYTFEAQYLDTVVARLFDETSRTSPYGNFHLDTTVTARYGKPLSDVTYAAKSGELEWYYLGSGLPDGNYWGSGVSAIYKVSFTVESDSVVVSVSKSHLYLDEKGLLVPDIVVSEDPWWAFGGLND